MQTLKVGIECVDLSLYRVWAKCNVREMCEIFTDTGNTTYYIAKQIPMI